MKDMMVETVHTTRFVHTFLEDGLRDSQVPRRSVEFRVIAEVLLPLPTTSSRQY